MKAKITPYDFGEGEPVKYLELKPKNDAEREALNEMLAANGGELKNITWDEYPGEDA